MLDAFRKPRNSRRAGLSAALIACGSVLLLQGQLRRDAEQTDRSSHASVEQLGSLLRDVADYGHFDALPGLVRGWVRTEPAVLQVTVLAADGRPLASAERPVPGELRRVYQASVDTADAGRVQLTVVLDGAVEAARRAAMSRKAAGEAVLLALFIWVVIVLASAQRSAARRYRVLLATNRLLLTGETEADLLKKICDVAVSEGGFVLAWIGLVQGGLPMTTAAASGPGQGYLEGLELSDDEALEQGRGPAGRAIRSRQAVFCNDFESDPTVAPWAKKAHAHGIRSSVALPLRHDGQLLGLLSLYSAERGAFSPAEIALVEQMAVDISLGVEYLRRGAELSSGLDRLRQIETTVHAGSFRFTLPEGSLWCSDGAASLLGRAPGSSVLGSADGSDAGADPAASLHELIAAATSSGEIEYDLPIAGPADQMRWLRVVGVVERSTDGRVEVRGLVQDVSERKSLEVAITHVADAERQQIASELHDNLGQVLTGTSLLVRTLENRATAEGGPLRIDLQQVGQFLQQALRICRTLAHSSMPDLVHGLGAALAELARQTTATGVACDARVAPAANALHGEQAIALYRIAQEAVTNALKHGSPSHIVIELRESGNLIELLVTDDGTGMPPRSDSPAAGLGQRTMRYRAARAGGTIAFRSSPDGGVTVHVRVRRVTHFGSPQTVP